MKYSTEQLINFWAIASMLSLILSAVSLFFFRFYSGKKSEEKFTEIGTQIQTEVNKAINEIDQTKTTLQLKLNNEVDSILGELRLNAKSANSSLDNLKTETSKLITDVKTDLGQLKIETQKTLDDIKNPIGTKFNLVEFKFDIPKTKFIEFGKSLLSNGDLDSSIEYGKKHLKNKFSVGIPQEKIPSEILNTSNELVWIRIRIIEKVTKNIKTSKELLSIEFNKPNDYTPSLSMLLNSETDFDKFILSIKSENIVSNPPNRTKGITSLNQICGKYAVVETAFGNRNPYSKDFDLEVSNLYITDTNLNEYIFQPLRNHKMILDPIQIKESSRKEKVITLGRWICK